jgi:hypothetical protein
MKLTNIPGLDEALNALQQGSRDGGTNPDGSIRNTLTPLPTDREFRVVVSESSFVTSQAGNPGIRFTLEITEGEFKGQRIWSSVHFSGHPFQGQRLAVLLTAAGADADTIEEAADAIKGGKLVVALQQKEGSDFPDLRWVNLDQGQKLREGLAPKKGARTSSPALSADSVDEMISKRTSVSTTTVPTPSADSPSADAKPPTPRSAGGIKLPGSTS